MTREVACHKGKCWEVKSERNTKFSDLFEDANIVQGIEKELWKQSVYGY